MFTLNLTFNWVKSSVAFLSWWNLSYCEVDLSFSPVRWGWVGSSDTTNSSVSLAAPLGSTYAHLLPITLALCCTERYGAGWDPNHHCRPWARQDINTHAAKVQPCAHTHKHSLPWHIFMLTHNSQKIPNADICVRSRVKLCKRGVCSGCDPGYTHTLE